MNDNYPKLLILNTSGEILSSVEMEKSNKDERWIKLDNKKDTKKIFIIDESGLIRTFNTELIEISTINLGYNIRFGYNEFDLNGNGLSEKVFILEDNNLLITQQNFKYPLLIPFESQITTIMECRYNNDKSLFVVTKEKGYILYYSKNPLFIFKYLIYAGIILVLYLFIALIRKLQLIQIEKKEKIRNKIYELQLKSFKNQMDPHFTFNVFNTIAYKIQKESPESYEAFM